MRPVKTIAVTNQKGGVGKTTTVVNLGAALAARGRDVCLIDLDAQSQLTLHFGIEVAPGGKTIYDILTRGADLPSAAVSVREHLAVVPSEPDLAAAEMELVGTVGREQVLADRLAAQDLPYEFVLIDCPPSLGLLTLNALSAADEVLIPLQAHFFGLQGLSGLFETVSLVRRRINPRLRVGGVMFCMFDRRTRLAGEVVSDLADFLASARGTDAPWAHAKIFQNAIRRNVKLAECPSYGKTIFDYEPKSHGAEDYGALADEFLSCFAAPDVQTEEAAPPPVEVTSGEPSPVEPEPAEIEPPPVPAEPVTTGHCDESSAPLESDRDAAPVAPPADVPDHTYQPSPPRPGDDVSVAPASLETQAAESSPSDGNPDGTSAPPSWSGPASPQS